MKNRDPSAHRIPLAVAPSIVSADEAKQYLDLQQVSNKALNRGKFDESRRAMKAMEKIGKFVPIFLHDPNEGHVELYPTIAEDIRHMLTLTEKCLDFWRTQILPEKSL